MVCWVFEWAARTTRTRIRGLPGSPAHPTQLRYQIEGKEKKELGASRCGRGTSGQKRRRVLGDVIGSEARVASGSTSGSEIYRHHLSVRGPRWLRGLKQAHKSRGRGKESELCALEMDGDDGSGHARAVGRATAREIGPGRIPRPDSARLVLAGPLKRRQVRALCAARARVARPAPVPGQSY